MNELITITDSIKARELEFNTDTVRLNLQKSIINIKPISNFPLTPWEITGLILITLVIAAVIFFLVRKFIGVKIIKSAAFMLKNSNKQAKEKLDELSAMYRGNLITVDHYYFEVSLVIREFIAGELKIDAPHLTSEQLGQAFVKFNLPESFISSASIFFQDADKVKFSSFRPDKAEACKFAVIAHQTLVDLNNLNRAKI